jgi:hypothetical protein
LVAFDGVTVAISVSSPPILRVRDVLSRLTPVTEIGFTVTAQVAVLPPSSVVTVMTDIPTVIAVTVPFESTIATPVLELDQVTFLFVAFEGDTVAVRVSVPPINRVSEVLFKLTPDTEIGITVTVQEAVFPPSSVVAIMVAELTPVAITLPFESTVATFVLELDQVTF